MLIYNTSFHITGEALVARYLQFMREEYIPRALDGGLLVQPRFMRILTAVGDDVFAYSLMLEAADAAALKVWRQTVGTPLERAVAARFGESVLMFSTVMKEVAL